MIDLKAILGKMHCQRGNILFLILLAVVLFAALSYAVTSSTRGGGKDVGDEKAQSIASALLQYASLAEQTVSRLKLTNGCSDTQLSFENGTVTGYANANAPADKRCHVFDPAGGGMAWQSPPIGANSDGTPYLFTAQICIPSVGTGPVSGCWTDGSDSDTELLIMLSGVNEKVCNYINARSDIAAAGDGLPPFSNGGSMQTKYKFTGTFLGTTSSNHIAGLAFKGRPTGCFEMPASAGDNSNTRAGNYVFYHTLLVR